MSLLQVARAEDSTVPFRQLTPICLLPPELLCPIFELVCCLTKRDTFTSSDLHRLTTLSLVCRQWHELIVNTPLLWRCIDFSLKERAECMLRRAKNAPITVKLTSNTRPPAPRDGLDSALSVLKEVDIGSVQAMHLQGDGKTLDQASRLFTQGEAPLLESLRISRSRSDIYPYPFILHRNTFSSPMPNLRDLSIYRCGVVWSELHPTAFSQLEELSLEKLSITAQTFQNLDNLRTLSITNVFLRDSLDSASPPSTGVFLPKLEKLKVISPFSQSLSIFDFVSFPSTTQVTVESEYRLEHRDLMTAFLCRCGLRLDNATKDAQRPVISALSIDASPRTSYEYTVVLTGWSTTSSPSVDITSVEPRFKVSLTCPSDELPVLLDELAEKISLPELNELRVTDRSLFSRTHWETFLTGLHNVHTLTLRALGADNLIFALSNGGEREEAYPTPSPPGSPGPSSSDELLLDGVSMAGLALSHESSEQQYILLPSLYTVVVLAPTPPDSDDSEVSWLTLLRTFEGRRQRKLFGVLKMSGYSADSREVEMARQVLGDDAVQVVGC